MSNGGIISEVHYNVRSLKLGRFNSDLKFSWVLRSKDDSIKIEQKKHFEFVLAQSIDLDLLEGPR